MEAASERQLFSSPEQLLRVARLSLGPFDLSRSAALVMITAAVVMAVLADLLFNRAQLGINVAIWHLALVVGIAFCSARIGGEIDRRRLLLFSASLGFSILVALRASPILQGFNLAAALGLLLLALALPPRLGLRRLGPLPLLLALAAGVASLGVGAYRLVVALRWQDAVAGRLKDDLFMAGRAFLVAVPILVVFGGLFIAADAVFEAKVKSLVSINLQDLLVHLLYLMAGFWVAVASIWAGVVVEVPDDLHADLPEAHRLRVVEIAVVLVPLTLLFLGFVLVQLRYLFGGADVVLESLDLVYSQYARRGFFELVIASSLLLPLLLAANWSTRRDRLSNILFSLIALALIGLLFVVMASAWQRLDIYVDALGLTELRFYVAVVLVWLMSAFVWFLICVIGPGRDLFLSGAVVSAVVILGTVNALNPDGLIARTNTSRIESGRSFDAEYAATLSADGVQSLIDRLGNLSQQDRCVLSQNLLMKWSAPEKDLRSFNLGRHWAHRGVDDNRTLLENGCG